MRVFLMAATKPMAALRISEKFLTHELEVDTPSRLHFTLIDLHGGLGRIDGGLGVALRSPRIRLNVRAAAPESETESETEMDGSSQGSVPARVEEIVSNLQNELGFHDSFDMELLDSIPMHIGLGSNTQLALAVTKAITYFMGMDLPSHQLAFFAKRGGTSGIGVATFEHGGFVMDAGHSTTSKNEFLPSHYSKAVPPKLMLRRSLPENWYFVVTTPYIGQGLSGEKEADVFKKYCPIPRREVEKLSHLILMKMLPAVAEEDIVAFGESLRTIQSIGFKRIENELQDKVVKELYDFYYDRNALGAGLSSFGPTTFALVNGEGAAKKLKCEIEKYLMDLGVACDVQYSNVDNEGSRVNVTRS
jgi:beta-ribofuranosylaminobenzene 5'-phosphate synthase